MMFGTDLMRLKRWADDNGLSQDARLELLGIIHSITAGVRERCAQVSDGVGLRVIAEAETSPDPVAAYEKGRVDGAEEVGRRIRALEV